MNIFTLAAGQLLALLVVITTTSSASAQLTEKVDAVMSKFVAEKEISGAVTMAIYQGDIIHFSAVGMADQENEIPMKKDTVFRIASLTKNYSALLVKILEEQGKLSVHDKVQKYIPEFSSIELQKDDGDDNEGAVDLRIWHLMTHTSGVDIPDDYSSCPDLETCAKKIAAQKLHFRPGTKWKYSKGMDVCGRIVEIVSGKAFDVFLKEQITDPLGLTDTAYWISEADEHRLAVVYMPDHDAGGITPEDSPYFQTLPRKGVKPNPSSGLFSSTRDVGVYYSMLLAGGVHDGKRIVSQDSIKDLTRNWTGTMKTNPISGMSWGLGFGHVREPAEVTGMLSSGSFGHGGAYGTQAWVDPVTKVIYVLMIQRRRFGNGDMSEIRKEFQRVVSENYKVNQRFLQSELNAQETPGTTGKSKAELNEKLKTAIGWGEVKIELTPKAPTEKVRGMWTPKAGTINLSEAGEVLSGRLALGEFGLFKMMLTIEKGATAEGSAQLKIDSNGDSKFESSETYEIEVNELRGKFWYSSPEITISLKSKEGKAASKPRPYTISLWHVVDPNEPGEKPVMRWTRQGWHEGQFTLGDQECTAVISDANLDGTFTDKDRWGMGETPTGARSSRNSTYAVSKHAWFDSVAYQITSFDKNGGWLKIRAIDVGITQAEEKAKTDPYAKDRKFPRSEKPVVFLHDYEEALALAKKEDKRVVVDFVTTWCGPCGMMDRLVYTAQPIFDKSKDVIFLKLDGDDEAKLKKQFKVTGYPTLILLGSDGKEISRRVGYQGVSRLLDFLKVDADQ